MKTTTRSRSLVRKPTKKSRFARLRTVHPFLAFLLGVVLCVSVVAITACDQSGAGAQQQQSQKQNTDAANRLHAAVPYPQLSTSVELQNQAEWYKRLNNPNEVGYIYVISYNLVFGPYQVLGKCSSTESQFSSPTSVIPDPNASSGSVVIPAPQPDGSYGQNEAAIFCFLDDANKTMVEFNSQWIWTEKPLVGLPTVPGSAIVPNGK